MAGTFVVFSTEQNLQPGTYASSGQPGGVVTLAPTDSMVNAFFTTSDLVTAPATTTIEIGSEISYDGGLTWVAGPKGKASGGVRLNRQGVQETGIGVNGSIPGEVGGVARQLRGSIQIVGTRQRVGPGTVVIS